jgi:hypothetical protein
MADDRLYEYDGEWTLTSSSADASFLIGNGKVACVLRSDAMSTASCVTTRAVDFSTPGALFDNTVPSLLSGRWEVAASGDDAALSGQTLQSSLNMYAGVHTMDVAFQDDIQVRLDRFALRDLAYCTMQSCYVTNGAPYDIAVRHIVSTDDADFRIGGFSFSGNMFTSPDGDPRYVLVADGVISDSQKPICVGVLYTVSDPSVSQMQGFQMIRKAGREWGGYPVFSVSAGNTATFHALTCVMTGHDFANPRAEVVRSLLSIVSLNSPAALRAGHTVAWSDMWRRDISVDAVQAPDPNREKVLAARQVTRMCIYTMYSSVRPASGAVVTVSVPNLTRVDAGTIDPTGGVIGGDDMWVLPALTLLAPSMARSILEFRYNQLAVALQSAKHLGFSGVRYPTADDPRTMSSYSATWAPVTNSLVYNTCLILIHAWNYYRLTQDIDYLESVGYPIIKGCAQFIADRVTPERDDMGAYFDLVDVADMDGNIVRNDCSNVFLARAALKYANETMLAMGRPTVQLWTDIVNAGLRTSYFDIDEGVLLPRTFYEDADPIVFPTTLLPLHPFYYDAFTRLNPTFSDEMHANNLTYALTKYDDPSTLSTDVCAIVASCAARVFNVTQSADPMRASSGEAFDAFFGSIVERLLTTALPAFDVRVCAAVVLIVLSMCGVYVSGGHGAAGIYAPMTVMQNTVSNMPPGWESVTLRLAASATRTTGTKIINTTF